MGILKLFTHGSFLPRLDRGHSAEEYGHAAAVRDGIKTLRGFLRYAVAQDAKLRAAGHGPSKGWRQAERLLMDLHDRGDPREGVPILELIARDLAPALEDSHPPGWGFALISFSYGPDGAISFISNAQRADMVKALRSLLNRWEEGRMGSKGESVTGQTPMVERDPGVN